MEMDMLVEYGKSPDLSVIFASLNNKDCPSNLYSHDQNYWRFTTFFTKSPNRRKDASNSTVWGISPQPGHFLSFRLADVVDYALPHPRNQTANDRSQHST